MSLPGANQKIAQGQQAARQVQLQEQIKNVPQGMGGPGLAQKMGAQQAQQAGQIQLGAKKQQMAQAQQIGQMGLQQMGREQRQTGFEQQLTLSDKQREFANKLNRLDSRLKNQLLDNQLEFRKDKANQTLLNERQMLDYALMNAKSNEDFENYRQAAQQASKKELLMLEVANQKITQALNQGYIEGKGKLDRNLQKELRQRKKDIEDRIRREKEEAKNRAMMWSAGGAIIGGAIGAFAGGPAGASAGVSIGSGLGQTASSLS